MASVRIFANLFCFAKNVFRGKNQRIPTEQKKNVVALNLLIAVEFSLVNSSYFHKKVATI